MQNLPLAVSNTISQSSIFHFPILTHASKAKLKTMKNQQHKNNLQCINGIILCIMCLGSWDQTSEIQGRWAIRAGHQHWLPEHLIPSGCTGLLWSSLSSLCWGPHIMQTYCIIKKKWPILSNSSPWFLCFISSSLFYWSSFSWPILTMMMLETTYWCYQNFDCLLHFLSFSYNSSFSYRVLWSFVLGLKHLWDY